MKKKGTKKNSWNSKRGSFHAANEGNVVFATYENKQGNKHTHRLNFESDKLARSFTAKFNNIVSSISSWGFANLPTAFSVYDCWVKINFDSSNPDDCDDESGAIKFTFCSSMDTKKFLIHYYAAVLGKSFAY